MRGWLSKPWRAPLQGLPQPLEPRRRRLAAAALSRIGQLPDTGKGSDLAGKARVEESTGTFPSKTRICRATRLPKPDGRPPKRRSIPELHRMGLSACPLPEGIRRTEPIPGPKAAAPCRGPTLRSNRSEDLNQQDRKKPRFLQDRSRHLPKLQPEGNRSLEPRPRRTEARRRGPHPPQSGAFTCKEMLARMAGGDNTKLPIGKEILCIVSPELHNSFTSCPQLYPQPGETRGETGGAETSRHP